MSYVDSTYYKDIFGGTILPDVSINQSLERASDQINTLTYNRIVGKGFNNLTEFQKDKIKKHQLVLMLIKLMELLQHKKY